MQKGTSREKPGGGNSALNFFLAFPKNKWVSIIDRDKT